MLNVSQSLLHPDQYRFGIKSPVLLYSLTQSTSEIRYTHNQSSESQNNLTSNEKTTIQDFDVKHTVQLETAFCKSILLL